ncbi:MAG TPA: 50S ribosomal protein L3 [bacterium]|jgi:large subunit ribosomal protein L3
MAMEIIGRKVQMGNLFNDDGTAQTVTYIELLPLTVTQVKTAEKDGYTAIQVGYDRVPGHKLSRPENGHQKHIDGKPFKNLTEFRLDDVSAYSINQELGFDSLEPGAKVNVIGVSKGRGFAGGMRRHGFHGQSSSHGTKRVHRRPMSSGATDAARVFKGTKKPGHMGHEQVTVKNLVVVLIDKETGILAIRGAVPGPPGRIVRIIPRAN